MAEIRLASEILGIFRPWVFFRRRPEFGGFSYLAPPRLALGVNVRLPRNFPRDPTEPNGRCGSVKWWNYGLEVEFPGSHLCLFLSYPPHLRRFRVFSVSALGVNVRPEESLPGPHGALENGRMSELRLESGFQGIHGAAFCFPFVESPPAVVSRI